MARRQEARSQLMDLFLHVADLLGCRSDRDLAGLAEVSVENIANWRSGAVKEFKPQTLNAIKAAIATRMHAVSEQRGWVDGAMQRGIVPLEVEFESGPSALQRQFVDRMVYDYLGHRFLYFDPQGALAWENLIRDGYEQDCWMVGVENCCHSCLDHHKDGHGRPKGAVARALSFDRRGTSVGLDVIGLGPGEGSKEVIVLRELLAAQEASGQRLPWLTFSLVDVSVPLLLTAARTAHREKRANDRNGAVTVLPFVADFEEGELDFISRLPTAREGDQGRRLVLLLGNVFGNVRHEERFLAKKLAKLTRPGDLIWIEVGVRCDNIEDDPVYWMTRPNPEQTAAYTNRIRLFEGPYRRWEAAIGRPPSELETRIWLRQDDDSCPIPGSINFCHDLVIRSERRACTMLYSKRYDIDALCAWWEAQGYQVELITPVLDSKGVRRTVHVLVRRR